jgi:asparaginyl-tRNA synthetase
MIKDAPKKVGKSIKLRGWVYRKREQKDIVFIILRDSSGTIQLASKLPEARKTTVESSIEIEGKVKKDERAPGGYEIDVKKLKIIGLAERFPIARDLSEKFLRDVRHLWIRSRKLTQILKVRSEVFRAIHDFYHSKSYIEFQSPILTRSACEGSATLFEVDHPQKPIYLSQSWQLHAEAAIFGLEKIYTVTPAFRAEKSRTRRHLAEYWTAEAEAAWMSFEELLKHQEELILYVVKHVLKTCKQELKELGRDLKELKQLKAPFKRIKYKEAIKKLGKKESHDLTDKEERELLKKLGDKPLFLISFPKDMKAFYMKTDPKDPKTVLAVDLLLPGVGEVSGGSERISDKEELLKSIKQFKLDRKDYEWYVDLRRYGSVPHSGFGLGIERLVMWITGAEHIMDTIPFPRTMDRTYP